MSQSGRSLSPHPEEARHCVSYDGTGYSDLQPMRLEDAAPSTRDDEPQDGAGRPGDEDARLQQQAVSLDWAGRAPRGQEPGGRQDDRSTRCASASRVLEEEVFKRPTGIPPKSRAQVRRGSNDFYGDPTGPTSMPLLRTTVKDVPCETTPRCCCDHPSRNEAGATAEIYLDEAVASEAHPACSSGRASRPWGASCRPTCPQDDRAGDEDGLAIHAFRSGQEARPEGEDGAGSGRSDEASQYYSDDESADDGAPKVNVLEEDSSDEEELGFFRESPPQPSAFCSRTAEPQFPVTSYWEPNESDSWNIRRQAEVKKDLQSHDCCAMESNGYQTSQETTSACRPETGKHSQFQTPGETCCTPADGPNDGKRPRQKPKGRSRKRVKTQSRTRRRNRQSESRSRNDGVSEQKAPRSKTHKHKRPATRLGKQGKQLFSSPPKITLRCYSNGEDDECSPRGKRARRACDGKGKNKKATKRKGRSDRSDKILVFGHKQSGMKHFDMDDPLSCGRTRARLSKKSSGRTCRKRKRSGSQGKRQCSGSSPRVDTLQEAQITKGSSSRKRPASSQTTGKRAKRLKMGRNERPTKKRNSTKSEQITLDKLEDICLDLGLHQFFDFRTYIRRIWSGRNCAYQDMQVSSQTVDLVNGCLALAFQQIALRAGSIARRFGHSTLNWVFVQDAINELLPDSDKYAAVMQHEGRCFVNQHQMIAANRRQRRKSP